MEISKICSKCLLIKPRSLFYNDKRSKLGITSRCKNCIKIAKRSYNMSEETKLKKYEYVKNFRKKHPEKTKLYSCNNVIKIRECSKKAYNNNKDAYLKRTGARSKLLCSELNDEYILFLLHRIVPKNIIISQELIELKRIQLKTYRLCQQLQN
jgi:hypothetical protein